MMKRILSGIIIVLLIIPVLATIDWVLPFNSGSWYFTGGPHQYGSNPQPSGIDFAPAGDRTVYPIARGIVTHIGPLSGDPLAGNVIKIEHEDGWESWYLHLERFSTSISIGSEIDTNIPIAIAGGTGGFPIHLHVELRQNGRPASWDGVTIGGWTVNHTSNYSGYMENASSTIVAQVPVSSAQLVPLSSNVDTTVNTNLCSVSSSRNVNLRTGPGTAYSTVGSLGSGENGIVIGQIQGTDGFIWWQLETDKWVRFDVVDETGDCTSIPIVQAPPLPGNQTTNVDSSPNQTTSANIPDGFYIRASEPCSTNDSGVCLGFNDGYSWMTSNTSGMCFWSNENLNGYDITIANFCDGARYAHIEGTQYVKGPY